MTLFHYAFKVKDIDSTRQFYVDLLDCKEGRSTRHWIDFDFFGHQLSAHVSEHIPALDYCGKVDGVAVPIPHFGAIVSVEQFKTIQQTLEAENITFVVTPQLRYKGKAGEQWTMFFKDPSNNNLEFKAMTNPEYLFEKKGNY